MRIGLSYSQCVKEILEQFEKANKLVFDFDFIVSGTRFPDIQSAIGAHARVEWRRFQMDAIHQVNNKLWDENRLIQPRMMGGPFIEWSPYPDSGKIWVEVFSWAEFWEQQEDLNERYRHNPRLFTRHPMRRWSPKLQELANLGEVALDSTSTENLDGFHDEEDPKLRTPFEKWKEQLNMAED